MRIESAIMLQVRRESGNLSPMQVQQALLHGPVDIVLSYIEGVYITLDFRHPGRRRAGQSRRAWYLSVLVGRTSLVGARDTPRDWGSVQSGAEGGSIGASPQITQTGRRCSRNQAYPHRWRVC